MIKRAGTTWNEVVDILEDKSAVKARKPKPKPKPKPKKSFQPVKKFRQKIPAKKKGPKKEIFRKKADLPKIEEDEQKIDFQPEDRVARIVEGKKEAAPEPVGKRKVSQIRRRLLFIYPHGHLIPSRDARPRP